MKIEIKLPDRELKKISNKIPGFREGTFKGLKRAILFVEGKAKQNFGGVGQVGVITGTLRRSIKTNVIKEGTRTRAIIGSNVIYARIHEFGGQAGRGRSVRIPARPYIGPAITDNETEIKNIIQRAIRKEINKGTI